MLSPGHGVTQVCRILAKYNQMTSKFTHVLRVTDGRPTEEPRRYIFRGQKFSGTKLYKFVKKSLLVYAYVILLLGLHLPCN